MLAATLGGLAVLFLAMPALGIQVGPLGPVDDVLNPDDGDSGSEPEASAVSAPIAEVTCETAALVNLAGQDWPGHLQSCSVPGIPCAPPADMTFCHFRLEGRVVGNGVSHVQIHPGWLATLYDEGCVGLGECEESVNFLGSIFYGNGGAVCQTGPVNYGLDVSVHCKLSLLSYS